MFFRDTCFSLVELLKSAGNSNTNKNEELVQKRKYDLQLIDIGKYQRIRIWYQIRVIVFL